MNISSLMKEYLTESTQDEIHKTLFGQINKEVPIEMESKPAWETIQDPERLKRKFQFDNSAQVAQFILEVLQYEKESSHNGSILIEANIVTVEIYTHDLDAITELDTEYAKELGKIYKDVQDYEHG